MSFIWKYLKPYSFIMSIGMLIKIAGSVVELALPYILSHIIDNVVPMCKSTDDVYMIVIWGIVMVVCSVLAFWWNVLANRMASKVARDAARQIRHDLFDATMHLSASKTDEFTIPSLESRLTSDTYNIHQFLGMMQRLGVRAPILLVGGLAISLTLDPMLTLVMASIMPFIGVTVWLVSKKGIPLYKESQKAGDSMVRVVREDSQGIRVIKALSKKDYEKERYDRVNRQLVTVEKKAAVTMAATNPIINIFLNIGIVLVILVGAFRVDSGLSQAGKIIAFISYFTLISNAMLAITRIFVMYSKGAASASRISEVIETSRELAEENLRRENAARAHGEKSEESGKAHIVFDNVCFSYNGSAQNLENISFSLRRGESLGIIGATGSGKSTLIKLLMRMYDCGSGKIYIDGRDVRCFDESELSSMFGSVMQNDFVYADTIEENIKFGRDISHEDVVRAAKIAQAEEYIEKFDDKYEHHVTSKGTNISGGQKQRLLIARAVANNPEILILDDSSSALDYKTDSNLRRAIKENMNGVTSIIVAQRVSSVMYCDLILVLDEGKVIGSGKHDYLMENCEVYRQISDSQLGGALID